ncbi:MAG: hypothetical protein QOD69_582, partial [Solirubrobacteraceae bacterium]|nr:hypothetical protein [Solirubrobacteraceae bacterium]
MQRHGWAALALLATYLVLVRVLDRALAPRRHRALLQALRDPSAGPPAGAQPVALELAERWARALTARDRTAARDLLAEDLHVDSAARRYHGRAAYLRATRRVAAAYRDRSVQLDEALAETGAPDIAWVRFTQTARPRRGPALEATWWERWT